MQCLLSGDLFANEKWKHIIKSTDQDTPLQSMSSILDFGINSKAPDSVSYKAHKYQLLKVTATYFIHSSLEISCHTVPIIQNCFNLMCKQHTLNIYHQD